MDGFTALTLDLHIRIKALTNWLGNTTTAAGRLKLSGLEIEVRYYSCLGRFIIIFFCNRIFVKLYHHIVMEVCVHVPLPRYSAVQLTLVL